MMTDIGLDYAAVQSALMSGKAISIGALTLDSVNQYRDQIVADTIAKLDPWKSIDRET
jgi:hypothetical protein